MGCTTPTPDMGDADMARSTLPIHPSKRHPLTGEPLQALWIRPDGRVCWPMMGGDETAGSGDTGTSAGGQGAGTESGSGTQGSGTTGGNSGESELGFPKDTPVADMTEKQQAAYWKHQSRKHEDAWKQRVGDLTPEKLQELRDKAQKHDALEYELSSATDKAAKDAEKAAREKADAEYRPMLAETAFRVAIGDRKPEVEVEDFIADLNLSRFLTDDGRVDTAKVLARVEQFAPATGTTTPTPRRGPTPTGQGQRGTTGTGDDRSIEAGRELYRSRHKQ